MYVICTGEACDSGFGKCKPQTSQEQRFPKQIADTTRASARTSASGYKRRFGPRRWYDRSTPESRPSSGNVRFLGLEVRSTSDSRRRWARSARTGNDPKPTYGR